MTQNQFYLLIVLTLLVLNLAFLVVNVLAGSVLWALVSLLGVAAGVYSVYTLLA